jgi:hypothetical protein
MLLSMIFLMGFRTILIVWYIFAFHFINSDRTCRYIFGIRIFFVKVIEVTKIVILYQDMKI